MLCIVGGGNKLQTDTACSMRVRGALVVVAIMCAMLLQTATHLSPP